MSAKWQLTCMVCGKKESFGDSKDITFAKWRIIAWNVESGEPKVTCPKCEYKNESK